MRVLVFVLPVVLAATLGACGYKGPLYLPKPKPATQPAQSAPAQDTQKSDAQVPAKP